MCYSALVSISVVFEMLLLSQYCALDSEGYIFTGTKSFKIGEFCFLCETLRWAWERFCFLRARILLRILRILELSFLKKTYPVAFEGMFTAKTTAQLFIWFVDYSVPNGIGKMREALPLQTAIFTVFVFSMNVTKMLIHESLLHGLQKSITHLSSGSGGACLPHLPRSGDEAHLLISSKGMGL